MLSRTTSLSFYGTESFYKLSRGFLRPVSATPTDNILHIVVMGSLEANVNDSENVTTSSLATDMLEINKINITTSLMADKSRTDNNSSLLLTNQIPSFDWNYRSIPLSKKFTSKRLNSIASNIHLLTPKK